MAYLDRFSKTKKFDTLEEKIHLIPLKNIKASEQIRKHFNKEKIQELADSVQERGLQSPIRVRPTDKDNYTVLTGERRFRAHQILKETHIKAIVVTDQQQEDEIIADQLVENIQRENLNHIEMAKGFFQLKNMGKNQREISKSLGIKESKISKYLAIIKKIPSEYLITLEECCQKESIAFDTLHKIAQSKPKQKMKSLIEKLLEEINLKIEELDDIPEEKRNTTKKDGIEYDVDELWDAIKWVKRKDINKFISKLTPRQISWFINAHKEGEF